MSDHERRLESDRRAMEAAKRQMAEGQGDHHRTPRLLSDEPYRLRLEVTTETRVLSTYMHEPGPLTEEALAKEAERLSNIDESALSDTERGVLHRAQARVSHLRDLIRMESKRKYRP